MKEGEADGLVGLGPPVQNFKQRRTTERERKKREDKKRYSSSSTLYYTVSPRT
jgi:hypothetical protein